MNVLRRCHRPPHGPVGSIDRPLDDVPKIHDGKERIESERRKKKDDEKKWCHHRQGPGRSPHPAGPSRPPGVSSWGLPRTSNSHTAPRHASPPYCTVHAHLPARYTTGHIEKGRFLWFHDAQARARGWPGGRGRYMTCGRNPLVERLTATTAHFSSPHHPSE